ncbi:hypothetical protein GY45DRAFT_1255266, partial [Cubamyces sp. BRFM 1775]
RRITSDHLESMFQFHAVSREPMKEGLRAHQCQPVCSTTYYVFKSLRAPRGKNQARVQPIDYVIPDVFGGGLAGDQIRRTEENANPEAYLDIADPELHRAIIAEWEQTMSLSALKTLVCAICGKCTPPNGITLEEPDNIDFSLLRNDALPEHVLPVTYNRHAYGGAILHPKGLRCPEIRGPLQVCKSCRTALSKSRQPRFALSNWLYYGHECLPEEVKAAFDASTHLERQLVSRARASRISYRFCELKGHSLYGTDWASSQSCVKGNIAIHPQDATHLNDVLPPHNDVVKDSICAVFVGETKPSYKNIRQLKPILVRKSRVRTMINFLTRHNPMYKTDTAFRGLSQHNLDNLFGPDTAGVDEGIPCAMEIGHIARNDAVEGATSGYVPGEDDEPSGMPGEDMLIESVGYTDGDHSPVNYNEMTMKALSHCLKSGRFVQSQAGSRFVPDFENSQLLSWLFPHLDPWGIGGFFDERRGPGNRLSLEQQLKHLLTVEGSPFRNDPDFAFVFYNIKQKKAVFDSVHFGVPAKQRENVIRDLLQVDAGILDGLMQQFAKHPHYKPKDGKEVSIMRLLSRVNTMSHDLPGSNGYKIMLRNQIRALINHVGPPTLFITLNPSDKDHPLVKLYAGEEIDVDTEMRGEALPRWQRIIRAARNPSACAQFFDKMISGFIETIL